MPRVKLETLRDLRTVLSPQEWQTLKDGIGNVDVLIRPPRYGVPDNVTLRKAANGRISAYWHEWKGYGRGELKEHRVRLRPDHIWHIGGWNVLHREEKAAKRANDTEDQRAPDQARA